jgi:DNA-binding response OmpR family regulator
VERILVIDPDDRVAALLTAALELQGYAVDRIEGGPHAANLAAGGDYALVLLELLLPSMDGRDVLRQVCAERPDRKVFVVSSRDSIAERVEVLEAGAVDFVGKPFHLPELLARIDVRVAEGRPRPAGHTVRRGMVLDPMRRRARHGGQWVRLTEREYRVLEHLVDADPRVCSKDEVLANVWGIVDRASESRDVEMYVHRLRVKLGRDAIVTVRGEGYCINRKQRPNASRV